MAQVCHRCGGYDIGCPVCDAPPRRDAPYDRRVAARASMATFLEMGVTEETLWPVQIPGSAGLAPQRPGPPGVGDARGRNVDLSSFSVA